MPADPAAATPTRREVRPAQRVPLLVFGFLGLVTGVGAGLARLGYVVPDVATTASVWHGALMIGGFFGVVIALERAVAIGRVWAYLGPLLAGAGSAALIAGYPSAGAWLLFTGSVVLVAATLDVLRRQFASFTLTLGVAALCWAVGNLRFALGAAVHDVVAWWLAFLILTIAGERLELSRFVQSTALARRMFFAIVGVVMVALVFVDVAPAQRTLGAALVTLALWLVRNDIAHRTVRKHGLTRFIAVCLLSGYAWLAVGGAVLATSGLAPGARSYDAIVHALALGFVFSMVFGHAPIILPAVLRVSLPYTKWMYAPLVLLHASLAVRLIGDALTSFEWIRIGGLANAVALAAFIMGSVAAALRGRRDRQPRAMNS